MVVRLLQKEESGLMGGKSKGPELRWGLGECLAENRYRR